MVTVNPTVISRAEYALQVLSREAAIEGAYLFGSQVNGNTHKWSDIDIAAFVHHAESWVIIARAKKWLVSKRKQAMISNSISSPPISTLTLNLSLLLKTSSGLVSGWRSQLP